MGEIGTVEIIVTAVIGLFGTIFTGVLGLCTLMVKNLLGKQEEATNLGAQGVNIHAGNTQMNSKMIEIMEKQHEMISGLVEIHKDENSPFATIKLSEKITEMDKYLSQAKVDITETKAIAIKLTEKSNDIGDAILHIPEKIRNQN